MPDPRRNTVEPFLGFPPVLMSSDPRRASSRRRSSLHKPVVINDYNTKEDMILEHQLALVRRQQQRQDHLHELDLETELKIKEIVERISRPTMSSLMRRTKTLRERNDIGIICQYKWSSHGMKQYAATTRALYNKHGGLSQQSIKGKYHHNR